MQLIDPGTVFAEALNQLDFRVSKIFRLAGGRRVQANVDFFNLFNASAVLGLNGTYGPSWQRPTNVLQGRLIKFGGQIDF